MEEIVGDAGVDGTVLSFGAEWVYALAERSAPLPILRLGGPHMRLMTHLEPRGCDGAIERSMRLQPEVVVARTKPAKSSCLRRLDARLLGAGYGRETVSLMPRRPEGDVPGLFAMRGSLWKMRWHARSGRTPTLQPRGFAR